MNGFWNRTGKRGELSFPAGILALAGFAATFATVGPEKARFLAVFGGLFFSSGYALVRSTSLRTRWSEREAASYAFPLSSTILVFLLALGEVAGFGTVLFERLARPVLLASSALLFADRFRKGTARSFVSPLVLLLLLVGGAAYGRGSIVTISSDAPDHIAVIGEIQTTGKSFPVTSYYAKSTDETLDARKGFLLSAAAAAGKLTGAGGRDVYDALPAFAAVLFTLTFYALAREALGNGAAALLALAYGLLSHDGGVLGSWFGRSGSPYSFSGPLIWCALYIVLRAARTGTGYALPALFTGFALMGAHLFGAVTAFILAGLFTAALLIARRTPARRKETVMALLLLVAGAIPIGIWRFAATFPPADPIHTHLQGVVWVGEHSFFNNPFLAYSRINLFGIVALPLSLLLFRRAREECGILLAVSITLLPFLIILNPWIVPLLVPVTGYLLGRIAWYGGNFLVLGAIAASWFRSLRAGTVLSGRIAAFAGLILLHALFASSLYARDARDVRGRFTSTPFRLADAPRPELWQDLFDFMNRELPRRAVVAADPITGYLIPAFTGQKTIAVRAQHSSPGDRRAPERIDAMIRALSPYVSGKETAAILGEWNADYVLLNFRLDERVTSYLASIDPRLYGPTLDKFRSEPERYEEIYDSHRCHLFRIRPGSALPGRGESVLDARIDALPPGATHADHLFPNRVRLVGAEVSPRTVGPGDTVSIRCFWERTGDSDDPLPYKVYLRLQRTGAGDGQVRSKLARKWSEIRTGTRSRARTMRNPLSGAWPVGAWPVGSIVADRIEWRIPENMNEGTYELQVRLRGSPLVQVFYLNDFLREDDSFSGVPVAEVEVTAKS